MVLELAQKPLHEIVGKKGGVARNGDNVTNAGTVDLHPLKSCMDTGKRPRKACHAVSEDGQTKARKSGSLAIGIENDIGDLGRQARKDRSEDRSAAKRQ